MKWSDPKQWIGSRNMGGGVVFKVRSTQIRTKVFGANILAQSKSEAT